MDNLLATFSLTPADARMIPIGCVLFFLLWKLLSAKLFTPFLQVTETREAMTTGAAAAADEKVALAARLNEEIDERIRSTRVDAMRRKLDTVAAARAKAQQILERAEGGAAEQIKSARKEIADSTAALRAKSLERADALASELVTKLRSSDQVERR